MQVETGLYRNNQRKMTLEKGEQSKEKLLHPGNKEEGKGMISMVHNVVSTSI